MSAVGKKSEGLDLRADQGSAVSLTCDDGVVLGGHLWRSSCIPTGQVIINPATGVLARFYHRYARFLANHGFEVLTYDYRGIGASRPTDLRGCGFRWRDWGERDFETAVRFMSHRKTVGPSSVVGHSFGGVIPGLARSVTEIDRLLTVGAQYAWLGDYASGRRVALVMKWHVAMALLTACCGYFPGKRLGWLEDLPAGVAYEWSFRGPRFENSYPRHERSAVTDRIASFTAPILAIVVSDDEIGTEPAINRALDYYTGSVRTTVTLNPHDYCQQSMGHFNLFREERANDFWEETLAWLKGGQNAWLGNKR
jgi:predicted alpha/beta hydrolase